MPVDQSSRDRAPKRATILGPPAPRITLPPLQPQIPKAPYKPAVAAHDLPTTRDARQTQRAPYANMFGPGRSAQSPAEQIATRKANGTALTAKAQNALAQHLASIPHPVERLGAAKQISEAGILPTAAIPLVADTINTVAKHSLSFADPGKAQNILAGFPQLDAPPAGPALDRLKAAAADRGSKLPVNPTLGDYYKAVYGPKPDGWSGVYKNFPRDALLTPVYTVEGAYAGLQALDKAEHGDLGPLAEVYAQQADVVKHPKEFVQQHPAQALLAALSGGKAIGRFGALAHDAVAAAPLEATPRSVPLLDETGQPLPPVNGEVPALQRGTLSTRNLATRKAQDLSDAVLARSKGLQSRAVASTLRDARSEARATVQQEANKALKPFLDARSKVSRKEAQRVLENEARGITPDAHAAFRGQEPVATPDLTPAQHDLLTAAQGVERANVERLKNMGLLTDEAAQRRAYHPALQVANSLGHPTAEHFADLEREVSDLHDALGKVDDTQARKLQNQIQQIRSAKHADLERQIGDLDKRITRLSRVQKAPAGRKPRQGAPKAELRHLAARRKALVDQQSAITSAPLRALEQRLDETPTKGMVQGQLDQALADRSATINQFAAEHADAGGATPLRVAEQPIKRVQSKYAQGGGGSGIAAGKRRIKPYTGALFEHGTYKPITDDAFLRDAAVPSRLEQAYRFAAEVSDPKRGIVKHASPATDIPQGYVLQEVRSQANPLHDELAATTGTAPVKRPLESLMSTFKPEADRVPNDGKQYRLWPTTTYQQLSEMKGLNPPTGKGAVFSATAGRALRNALLYSRPAYPLTNMLGNMAQSAIIAGNVPFGPSYVDALRRSELPVPPRIEGTGAAAMNFDAIGSGSLRNAWEDRGSTAGGVARVALHPIAKYTQGLYKASVDIEDWTRRATYLAKAVPEARRLAHPEHGPVARFAASFKKADAATKDVLQQMADGSTPEARAAAQRAVKVVHQALGDFESMRGNRVADVVIPFWRWSNFVRQLMGVTLPIHYPGRALLLYRLGALGQQGQHQIGSLTPSLQGMIPLGPGAALTTQSLNPFATFGQDVMPSQGQTALDSGKIVGNLSPLIASAYNVTTGRDLESGRQLTNAQGQPITSGEDRLRLLLGEAANLIPATRALAPLYGGGSTTAPDTSVNLPGLVQQGPKRAGAQQPSQSLATNIINQVSPVKYRAVDLPLMARQGDSKLLASLRGSWSATAKKNVLSLAHRLADERHVDLDKPSQARSEVIRDAKAKWRASKP